MNTKDEIMLLKREVEKLKGQVTQDFQRLVEEMKVLAEYVKKNVG